MDVAQLRARGRKAVFSALLKVAMSAQERGWDRIEWESLVLDDLRSRLGSQVRGHDRPLTPRSIQKLMGDAWDRAWEHRTGSNQWTPADVAAEVARRAAQAANIAADAENDLTDPEREALVFVADEARRRGTTRVTLPRRAVQAALGLGERTTRTALTSLVAKGHLILVERGRPRGASAVSRAKAAVYELPTYLVSVNGLVGPLALSSGTPANEAPGTPALTSGTSPDLEAEMVTITSQPDGTVIVRGPRISPEVILAALQRGGIDRHPASEPEPDNVVPIRRKHA